MRKAEREEKEEIESRYELTTRCGRMGKMSFFQGVKKEDFEDFRDRG